MGLNLGSTVVIQSYKHDQSLHRIWEESTVLSDDEDVLVVANRRTKVIEANGRFWYSKEPSVAYFYKKRWFNVIGILKPDGITYYCNLSSPVVIDAEAVKYIDYDLDVKRLANGQILLLDQNEYRRHRVQMAYPPEICRIVEEEFKALQDWIRSGADPFRSETILARYDEYLKWQKSKEEPGKC